jgi:flagellin-like hook-associated protein FlgL
VGLAGNLALADLNEDGALDIISGQDENQSVALSDGAGGFFDPVTFFEAVAGSVYAGDFNNDGHQDVIISRGSSPQLSFFAGDGEGNLSFEAHSVLDAGINSSNIAMGDIDQDGDLDFIYGNADQVSLALNNGSGNFTVSATKYSIPEGSIGTSLKIELRLQDLNADGRVDIVARNRSAASVLLGQGGGGFSSAKTLADSFRTFALGDLNGDEIVDLVAFSDSSTLVFEAVVTTAAAADGVRIQTQAQAQKLLGILDYAIDKISEESFKLGKLSNRLDYAQSVTAQTRENLLAARSQIMDTDLAEETAELTRLQILQQAQASVLSQSNVSMQIALQLLSF